MKKPKLSVIFPMLDASEDVQGVFASVASQTGIDRRQVEIIVVDDGSSDDTPELIEKHKDRFSGFADFKVIKHKSRLGLAQTRYDGARAAQGEYLTFVDKRTRPDNDYLANLLNKRRDIVIGNVYMTKTRSIWDRLLVVIRKKLYFPYFNHTFDDIELDQPTYRKFKNKGGGGVMLVKRQYYLDIAKNMNRGKDVNDDSFLIDTLAGITPILKTASANAQYLNRTGFWENVKHLYNRGPKFVDYYTKPSTRFFPLIVSLLTVLAANVVIIFVNPRWLVYELAVAGLVLLTISVYLAEEPLDLIVCLFLLPLALVTFCLGILKGLAMKLTGRY